MLKLKIDKTASAKLLKLLNEAPAKFEQAVAIGLHRIGDEMRNKAGRFAPRKSGNLARSLTVDGAKGSLFREFKNRVVVGTNLVYAPIHEFGGIIVPKRKKLLAWKTGGKNGKWIFAKRVRIPKYKGRGYMKPSFDLAAKKAKRIMNEEIEAVIR